MRPALAVLVLALAVSCGGARSVPSSNPVTGEIVRVDGESMLLRVSQGEDFEFVVRERSVTIEHLQKHRDERWPVSVTFRVQGEELLATKIDDA